MKLTIKMKLIFLAIVIFVVTGILSTIGVVNLLRSNAAALQMMETRTRGDYDEMIKKQVDNVISVTQTYYAAYQEGTYSLEEAEKLAADQIRQIRYGDSGYFWVDTYDGINVVATSKDTEGKSRIDLKDGKGFEMIRPFLTVPRQIRKTGFIKTTILQKKEKHNISPNVHMLRSLHRLTGWSEQEIIQMTLIRNWQNLKWSRMLLLKVQS